ncbi:ORF1052 [White spot syndrome virus]|uniref:ORF1052 n=1 Tax=White spot syndrome virus TaxID=342409 RepID=A0A2D3I6J5_9VIRU|nr:ORF1052 [White spot syndrome virus]
MLLTTLLVFLASSLLHPFSSSMSSSFFCTSFTISIALLRSALNSCSLFVLFSSSFLSFLVAAAIAMSTIR